MIDAMNNFTKRLLPVLLCCLMFLTGCFSSGSLGKRVTWSNVGKQFSALTRTEVSTIHAIKDSPPVKSSSKKSKKSSRAASSSD